MFPLPVIPNRHPFAPPALPGFIARMGASDFRRASPLPRFSGLSEGCLQDGLSGSPWLPRCLTVRLDAALDPGVDPCTHPIAQRSVACRLINTVGLSRYGTFRGSTPSRSAHADTIAPRLLLRLRIKRTVASAPARLNSRPVVSGYLGRLRTCKTTRPCQAATNGRPSTTDAEVHSKWDYLPDELTASPFPDQKRSIPYFLIAQFQSPQE